MNFVPESKNIHCIHYCYFISNYLFLNMGEAACLWRGVLQFCEFMFGWIKVFYSHNIPV